MFEENIPPPQLPTPPLSFQLSATDLGLADVFLWFYSGYTFQVRTLQNTCFVSDHLYVPFIAVKSLDFLSALP